MPFDNLCKLLSQQHPARFAAWILGEPQAVVKVLKTELSIEPIRADSVTFLQTQDRLLHLEFQVKLESDPPLPLRMLDYWVRLYRLYRLPITQAIVLLLPPSERDAIETTFAVEATRYEYSVIKMWQLDPALLLNDVALLPLAPLAAAKAPEQLLNQVAQQVSKIESTQQRQQVSAYTQLLAGLRFKKALVKQIFREGMMRESVIYQEILQEGRQEEGVTLILRQLTRRSGTIDEAMQAQIAILPLALLEDLGEALLVYGTHGFGGLVAKASTLIESAFAWMSQNKILF
ncbi:MAG: Rpn family recombination-promoting nuclease/putative transposase [Stenomitos rutilans HA7619-LM2]|jgi:predicted transposase YdaD|nr:Rpn family recombination-promoting nuclease/putative transposase [Stenomitos rutilans HA7619-LM2]